MKKDQIAAFCDRQAESAQAIRTIPGNNFQQAIINNTMAVGMEEIITALRTEAGIE